MIRRLKRRMTLLVILALVLVSVGIVLAVHLSNERNIASQAEASLAVMAGDKNSPGRGEMPEPEKERRENVRCD